MLIPEPPRPPRRETILPMINVVFLLLIFFLISARLTPPEPFAVTVPEAAEGDPGEAPMTLFMDATGQLGFRDALGEEAALAALAAALDTAAVRDASPRVLLRADKSVPGAAVAALLPKLGALGLSDVSLVTALP